MKRRHLPFWNGDSVPYGLKKPRIGQNTPLVYNISSIHQILMKFCQNLETLVMNIKVLLLTPKKLVRVPLGVLGLKNAHFRGFSDVCSKCHYVCCYSGFFIVPNSNLHMSLHETSSFAFFGTETASPMGLKMP